MWLSSFLFALGLEQETGFSVNFLKGAFRLHSRYRPANSLGSAPSLKVNVVYALILISLQRSDVGWSSGVPAQH